MFFRKIFGRDCRQLKEKGDRYLADGRFADARHAYEEALEKIPAGDEGEVLRAMLNTGMTAAGNGLAEMNIEEARLYLNQENRAKAQEYLELAMQLAEDGAVREKAENLMRGMDSPPVISPVKMEHGHHGCSSCNSAQHQDMTDNTEESLSLEDRFHLLTQALPGELANRYANLGEKFAYGYIELHEGNLDAAFQTFTDLTAIERENDILLYELGALTFRKGDVAEAERLFKTSVEINPFNPLTHLGLAQLLIFTKRLDEALTELGLMVENGLLANEALVMIGDVWSLKGEDGTAIDHFAKLLEDKSLQKVCAERLVPLLMNQGRETEAQFLAKQYLKGCC
jgi:tetratricopeptide (TPR) repeat protein